MATNRPSATHDRSHLRATPRRKSNALRGPAVLLASLLLPDAIAALESFAWPGAAPCATLELQACLDAVPDGSLVQVRTNEPVGGVLELNRGLILTAADGFSPTLAALRFRGAGGELAGFLVREGVVVFLVDQPAMTVTLHDNIVRNGPGPFALQVVADPWPSLPIEALHLTIDRNQIESGRSCLGLHGLAYATGSHRAVIARNQMRCDGSAIQAQNGRGSQELSISGNQISSVFGIRLDNSEQPNEEFRSPLEAKIAENQLQSLGRPALQVVTRDPGASIEIVVFRNVVSGVDSSFGLHFSDPLSAWLSGSVSENVLSAYSGPSALYVEGAERLRVANNLFLGGTP